MKTQNNRYRAAYKVVFSVAVLFGLLTVLHAQEGTSQKRSVDSPLPYSQQAKTFPISKSKISLRLTFDDGEPFEVTQLEGGMIRASREGSTIGITPYLDGDGIKAKVFRIFSVKEQGVTLGEGISEIESLEIGRQATRVTKGDWGLRVELIRVERESEGKKKDDTLSINSKRIGPLQADCCVTCSGNTACACYASGSCGSCCVGSCCN